MILETEVEDAPTKLGNLMNESHKSLADLYECSCKELNTLVELGRKNGSLGSRLTGAGFGGSTVHLVYTDSAQDFIKSLSQGYYSSYDQETKDNALFQSNPESGACICQL